MISMTEKPRAGRGIANIGPERDLEAAAESDAMNGGDHRHRNLAPDHRRILRAVGHAMAALGKAAGHARLVLLAPAARHAAEIAHVESGAEGAAFAGKHDRAHRLVGLEFLARLKEAREHRIVERVHLVRPHEADIGDAFIHRDLDALFHGVPPLGFC